MRKINMFILIGFLSAFIIVYILYIYPIPMVAININDIYIDNYNINVYADENDYGFNLDDINNKNIKKVLINLEVQNKSYIKPVNDIKLSFSKTANLPSKSGIYDLDLSIEEELNLPDYIVGNKISTDNVESLNLKPRERKNYTYCFLVSTEQYDNNSIIKNLRSVDLYIYGTCYREIDFKKSYFITRGPRRINYEGIKCTEHYKNILR